MTERFDHVERAIELGDMATDSWNAVRPEAARAQMEGAQVHATLALVEQQRIANLLAIAHWVSNEHLGTKLDDLRMGAAGEVWEGLGLL